MASVCPPAGHLTGIKARPSAIPGGYKTLCPSVGGVRSRPPQLQETS